MLLKSSAITYRTLSRHCNNTFDLLSSEHLAKASSHELYTNE